MVGVGSRSPDLQRSHVGLEESSSHRLGSYLVYLRGEFCRGIWVVFGIVGNTEHSFQTLEKAFRLDLDVFVFVLFSPDRLKLCKHLTWHEMFFFWFLIFFTIAVNQWFDTFLLFETYRQLQRLGINYFAGSLCRFTGFILSTLASAWRTSLFFN